MYFSSHSSDKQYFSSQKIDENVVFLATTHYKSGLTRRELPCVVTRNETLSGYRYCINEDGVEVERERTMVGQRRIWGGEMDAISQSPGEAPINKN